MPANRATVTVAIPETNRRHRSTSRDAAAWRWRGWCDHATHGCVMHSMGEWTHQRRRDNDSIGHAREEFEFLFRILLLRVLLFRLAALLDQAAKPARMLAIKGLAQAFTQRSGLHRIRHRHRHPGRCLQHSPLPADGNHQSAHEDESGNALQHSAGCRVMFGDAQLRTCRSRGSGRCAAWSSGSECHPRLRCVRRANGSCSRLV